MPDVPRALNHLYTPILKEAPLGHAGRLKMLVSPPNENAYQLRRLLSLGTILRFR